MPAVLTDKRSVAKTGQVLFFLASIVENKLFLVA